MRIKLRSKSTAIQEDTLTLQNQRDKEIKIKEVKRPRRQEGAWKGVGAGVRSSILVIVVKADFLEEVSALTYAG